MTGGSNGNEGLARVQILADGVQLILWWKPTAGAEDEQVGLLQGLGEAGEMVLLLRVFKDNGAMEVVGGKLGFGEFGERFPGLVFIFSDHEHDVGRGAGGPGEGGMAENQGSEKGKDALNLPTPVHACSGKWGQPEPPG